MLFNLEKYIVIATILLLANCASGRGFFSPITLNLESPDGPAEYKAGWYAGCRSGMAVKAFRGSWVYDMDFGNGVYQHDPVFQNAWQQGWFACRIHNSNFPRNASQAAGDGKWSALSN